MRRLLVLVVPIVLAVAGCDNSPTGPQTTVDGNWVGLTQGYQLSVSLAQADTLVTGSGSLAGISGNIFLDIAGTIKSRHMIVRMTN